MTVYNEEWVRIQLRPSDGLRCSTCRRELADGEVVLWREYLDGAASRRCSGCEERAQAREEES